MFIRMLLRSLPRMAKDKPAPASVAGFNPSIEEHMINYFKKFVIDY